MGGGSFWGRGWGCDGLQRVDWTPRMEAMTDVAILLICVFASRWTGNGRNNARMHRCRSPKLEPPPLLPCQAQGPSVSPGPVFASHALGGSSLSSLKSPSLNPVRPPGTVSRIQSMPWRFRIDCCWVLTLNCLKTLATYPSRSSSPDFRFNAYFFTCMALLILVVLEIRRQ